MSMSGAHEIAARNDAARAALCSDGSCRLELSGVVQALTPASLKWLLQAVQTFEDFRPAQDPLGYHSGGTVELEGATYVWKFEDYSEKPGITLPKGFEPLVLAIMRADEDDP